MKLCPFLRPQKIQQYLKKHGGRGLGGVLVGEGRREMLKASKLLVIQVQEEDEC